VIVPVFNGIHTLQKCLDSIRGQTYPHVQTVVIDGGSNDGTVELLCQNEASFSYWISEKDNGIYDALNKGVRQARGDWVCILGADDFFYAPDVLEKMAAQLRKLPDQIRIAYGQVMLLDEAGQELFTIGGPWPKVKNDLRQIMSLPYPGLMHRGVVFTELGGFDLSFRIAGDYELLLRELIQNDAHFVPSLIMVGMTQGGISSKPRNGFYAMLEGRRAQKMHGIRWPGPKWLWVMFKIFCRILLWEILGGKLTNRLVVMTRSFRKKL
jgi:glycosyltransferase involved in cell wall biosynthesis